MAQVKIWLGAREIKILWENHDPLKTLKILFLNIINTLTSTVVSHAISNPRKTKKPQQNKENYHKKYYLFLL